MEVFRRAFFPIFLASSLLGISAALADMDGLASCVSVFAYARPPDEGLRTRRARSIFFSDSNVTTEGFVEIHLFRKNRRFGLYANKSCTDFCKLLLVIDRKKHPFYEIYFHKNIDVAPIIDEEHPDKGGTFNIFAFNKDRQPKTFIFVDHSGQTGTSFTWDRSFLKTRLEVSDKSYLTRGCIDSEIPSKRNIVY